MEVETLKRDYRDVIVEGKYVSKGATIQSLTNPRLRTLRRRDLF